MSSLADLSAKVYSAAWECVQPEHHGAVRKATASIAGKERLDTGRDGRCIGNRPQLHLGHGKREKERLPAHDGSIRAGIRDQHFQANLASLTQGLCLKSPPNNTPVTAIPDAPTSAQDARRQASDAAVTFTPALRHRQPARTTLAFAKPR